MAGGRHTRKHKRGMKGGNFYGAVADPSLGTAGLGWGAVTNNGASTTGEIPKSDITPQLGGRKRRGLTAKAMKKLLKKAGMKTTGKKAALTRRLKKAKMMRGGASENAQANMIPSPHASAGYTGNGVAGLINVQDVAGGVSNQVMSA